MRHSAKKATERHYAGAMLEPTHHRDRRDVLIDKGVSLGERPEARWLARVTVFTDVIPKLGMDAAMWATSTSDSGRTDGRSSVIS